ncbi:MAG: PHP domain-containing protein [Peptococcaceae bacterium]|nr:PHP domain-containing protein [Peptococcaceae bacterium]
MPADLHTHTTASDGTSPPAELVYLAQKMGLEALGITDHDTVAGIPAAQSAAAKCGILLVPGVELNTDDNGVEVHILGYYPDLHAPSLLTALSALRQARTARVKYILDKLAAIGLPLEETRVFAIAGSGSVGRPHIAQAMQEKGYVADIKDAFNRYIGVGQPAYVDRYKLTPQEGIEIIRQAKGIAVLAHPGLIGRDELLPKFIKAGLQGIEVYHSSHSAAMEAKYANLALELNLAITGGSDYHGGGRKAGVELGQPSVSIATVYSLMQFKEEIG